MTRVRPSMPARLVLSALGLVLALGAAGPTWAQNRPAPNAAASKSTDPFDAGAAAEGRGDYAEAVRLYKLAAAQGDAEAQDLLGGLYKDGRGVAQDFAEAMRWYRLAAAKGDADAQFNLGLMSENGLGGPQDYAEAARWYRLGSAQGDASAENNLGALYKDGHGVPQDFAEAVRWYQLAAAQGFANAQFNLGLMYGNGQGVPQDYVQAHKWFNLAASYFSATETENRDLAIKARDIVTARMTPAQITAAQKLAQDWKPTDSVPGA